MAAAVSLHRLKERVAGGKRALQKAENAIRKSRPAAVAVDAMTVFFFFAINFGFARHHIANRVAEAKSHIRDGATIDRVLFLTRAR